MTDFFCKIQPPQKNTLIDLPPEPISPLTSPRHEDPTEAKNITDPVLLALEAAGLNELMDIEVIDSPCNQIHVILEKQNKICYNKTKLTSLLTLQPPSVPCTPIPPSKPASAIESESALSDSLLDSSDNDDATMSPRNPPETRNFRQPASRPDKIRYPSTRRRCHKQHRRDLRDGQTEG